MLINIFRIDFIPIGIVDKANSNNYIVNKGLYNVKLYSEDEYKLGDILYFNKKGSTISELSDLRNNCLYSSYECKYLSSFKLKNKIYERINEYDNNVSAFMFKVFYNINNNDYNSELISGISFYILIKLLKKYNSFLPIILVLLFSLLFCFNAKYYLIIIDFIVSLFSKNKTNSFCFKIILFVLLNKYLLSNYSILINFIYSANSLFNNAIPFTTLSFFISSFMFGKINLLNCFFYKQLSYFRIGIIIVAFLSLFIPWLVNPLSFILGIINNIENIFNFSIRGELSLLSLAIFIITIFSFKNLNWFFQLALLTLLVILPINNPFMHITYINVGQGDAILIKGELNKYNILIDTGSSYNYNKLKTYLYKQGIYNIDYLIITHNDEDHNGNVEYLKKDFTINNVITEPQNIDISSLSLKNYYLGQYDNDNDNSLIYATKINNLSFLFTGDISKDIERKFVNQYGPITFDFLKVSHHGSNTATSDYFVANTLPSYGIISTSGKYNHPAENVVNTLVKYDVSIFNTKESGNIEIYFFPFFNLLKTDNFEFVIIK